MFDSVPEAGHGLIMDLDGTVYLGDALLPGARVALQRLRAAGYRVVFVTNKSIARAKDYAEKLNGLGVEANVEDIVTVNAVLAEHLVSLLGPHRRVLVVGEAPLREEISAAGLAVTEDPLAATAVALGWDREFDYPKLHAIFRAARNGAYLAATNPDTTCPTPEGEVPDCGALIAAVEAAVARPVDVVVGKPAPVIVATALERLGLTARHCWVIGDRLDTDIRMAVEAGLRSALVLTGVTGREAAAAGAWRADLVCADLAEAADRLVTDAPVR